MSCLKGEQRLLHFSTAIKVLPLENDDSVTEEDFDVGIDVGIVDVGIIVSFILYHVFILYLVFITGAFQ